MRNKEGMLWFKRTWLKVNHLRLEPIRVFCLHHISDRYDSEICSERDWISPDVFKESIERLRKKYTFITIEDAYCKITRNIIRWRKYAVLTFDDGYASPLSVFEWLNGHMIPYTLFLNAKYLDGKSGSAHILRRAQSVNPGIDETTLWNGLYITEEQLKAVSNTFARFGSHGYEHLDATAISEDEFKQQIEKNLVVLKDYPQFVHFHAYTWGRHTNNTDIVLQKENLVPVLMDGQKNYNNPQFIHRELFPVNTDD